MNISISEIFLVVLIALLVIKPEQLPEVASAIARFVKSIRSLVTKVKTEMNGYIDSSEQVVKREQREQS